MSLDQPTHVLAALPRRRFLVSSWPWRSAAYLVTTVPAATCAGVGLLTVALPWFVAGRRLVDGRPLTAAVVVLLVVSAGMAAAFGPPVSVALAAVERWRLGIVDGRPAVTGHRPAPGDVPRWLAVRYREAATWREVAYAVFLSVVVPAAYGALVLACTVEAGLVLSPWLARGGPVTLGIADVTTARQAIPFAVAGFVALPLLPYLVGLLAAGQAAVARVLLAGGGDDAAAREVALSRARLVDAYETERRRIERDLHDGAQHRLTSLTLQLGMARLDVPDDSPAAAPLARAHEQAKQLMEALRDLIHGIRPQSLTDLGLPAAVRELAERSPIPVTVHDTWPATGPGGETGGAGSAVERCAERVESAAYFAVAEALANVAKHSGATRAEVSLSRAGGVLVVEVRDDGRGGADPARGTGLTGLTDRVAAVNGRLLLSSPPGGPTLVRVELPCEG